MVAHSCLLCGRTVPKNFVSPGQSVTLWYYPRFISWFNQWVSEREMNPTSWSGWQDTYGEIQSNLLSFLLFRGKVSQQTWPTWWNARDPLVVNRRKKNWMRLCLTRLSYLELVSLLHLAWSSQYPLSNLVWSRRLRLWQLFPHLQTWIANRIVRQHFSSLQFLRATQFISQLYAFKIQTLQYFIRCGRLRFLLTLQIDKSIIHVRS